MKDEEVVDQGKVRWNNLLNLCVGDSLFHFSFRLLTFCHCLAVHDQPVPAESVQCLAPHDAGGLPGPQ
jgi:hypothetical protein